MCQTEPAEEAKRRSLSSSLENEGPVPARLCPFAPFRDRLLSCRAARALARHSRAPSLRRFSPTGLRITAPATYPGMPVSRITTTRRGGAGTGRAETGDGLPRLFLRPLHRQFPVPEVEAAARAGLGVVGDNGLLIHPFTVPTSLSGSWSPICR